MSDRTFVALLISPAALFFLVFVIYPVGLLVFQSFQNVSLLTPASGTFAGLDNYVHALTSPGVLNSAWLTLVYTVITLAVEFLLGLASALIFNALGTKSAIARTIFLFPLMVAPVVAGLLWKFMLASSFGIVNYGLASIGIIQNPQDLAWLSDPNISLLAVTLPDIWLTTCFMSLILYTGLQGIPLEIIEAARIDGANAVQQFWNVTLPLLRPVIAVALIIRGLDAARTFDAVWIMTQGGPQHKSEVLSLYVYLDMIRYGRLGEAAAVATLFLIALLAVSMVAYYLIWRPGRSNA
ncbi:MAG: sugar ABC transporter permease [Chloroflexota bacterium]|nr:sugar ABC transporter permease [Chloroflexota bacterium]